MKYLTSFPCALTVYPTARTRYSLRYLGLWFAGRMMSGIGCGYSGLSILSSYKPSCRERLMPWRCSLGVAFASAFRVKKSVIQ